MFHYENCACVGRWHPLGAATAGVRAAQRPHTARYGILIAIQLTFVALAFVNTSEKFQNFAKLREANVLVGEKKKSNR